MSIRNEQPSDYRLVEEITREAFWNLYCPGCSEHYIVNNMRKHKDFIPELSFVIEQAGEVVGSIFYTHSKVISNEEKEYKTITFGPVSILPRLHRKGLGKALISHSIEVAKQLGYNAIIIGGFPHHYRTYGFVGSKKYGISLPDGKFYTGIMALPLYEGALDHISGKVYFSDALEVDQNCVEEFDKGFDLKEKKEQESQVAFAAAVSEIDE